MERIRTPGETTRPSLVLPWRAWDPGPEERAFAFPEGWAVERLGMIGWRNGEKPDLPGLGRAVRSLCTGAETVSIGVDDLTRPARLGRILATVVEAAKGAGVRESEIDIIMALGAHRVPEPGEVARKLGKGITDRFPVRFHDPAGDLADTGLRLGRIPLRIDGRFLAASRRIAIGTVIPNPFAGFSGGGKMVVPGLASREALRWLHQMAMLGFGGGTGKLNENRVREVIDRVARELPLHFAVASLVDPMRQVREVHYGEPVATHRTACTRAREVYATPMSGSYDLLFCNAYPKDAEFLQAENGYSPLRTGALDRLRPGGGVVLMAASHLGRGHHGLFDAGMPLHRPATKPKRYLGGVPVYVYAPGIEESDCRVTHYDQYPHFRGWESLIELLQSKHGTKLKVGVFPTASCQLGPPS